MLTSIQGIAFGGVEHPFCMLVVEQHYKCKVLVIGRVAVLPDTSFFLLREGLKLSYSCQEPSTQILVDDRPPPPTCVPWQFSPLPFSPGSCLGFWALFVQFYNKLSQSCTTAFFLLPYEHFPLYTTPAALLTTWEIILVGVLARTTTHSWFFYYLGE